MENNVVECPHLFVEIPSLSKQFSVIFTSNTKSFLPRSLFSEISMVQQKQSMK